MKQPALREAASIPVIRRCFDEDHANVTSPTYGLQQLPPLDRAGNGVSSAAYISIYQKLSGFPVAMQITHGN